MEVQRRGIVSACLVLLLSCAVLLLQLSVVSATRFTVGGNKGWTTNVNYTQWAQSHHFYVGDWLYFVYDRTQMDVLEVSDVDYEQCVSDNPLHNWTTGAGRDVVPLNVTKQYYFTSDKGFCWAGLKFSIKVDKLPSPPTASPVKNGSPARYGNRIVIPALFAIAAVWDSFILLW